MPLLRASSPADVCLAAGAVVAAAIRRAVLADTGFECSAGVAQSKMLAKLASGRNKPNAQTIVPPAAVQGLMARLPIRKIRFLGAKLGEQLEDEVLALVDGAPPPLRLIAAALGEVDESEEEEVGGDGEDNAGARFVPEDDDDES